MVQAQPLQQSGWLKVSGTRLVNEQTSSWCCTAWTGWHNLWPRLVIIRAPCMNWIYKKWHCNIIRASMGIELNDSGYLKSPKQSVKLVSNVIDACIREGVYVIIDWHDHNIRLPKEAKNFWKDVGGSIKTIPILFYEVFNEPDYESWAEVKNMQKSNCCYTCITYKNIMVGCPNGTRKFSNPPMTPSRFQQLMYTMHFMPAHTNNGCVIVQMKPLPKDLPVL